MAVTGATTQTASILVTDVVGSTELRARIGEDRADALRREHDRFLADVVTRHGGTVVKGMGDGVLAMFPGAAEALAAAVDAQRAADAHTRRKPDEPLVLRAGLSAGDISVEDGDCFGTPVIQASRLCAAAAAGQILAAEVMRWLSSGRGDVQFDAVGSLELKGLPEPVPTVAVRWEPSVDVTGVPLPSIFAAQPVFAFAGRDESWQPLKSAWVAASHGEGQIVLVAGEPGIGKTRLATELARVVADEGGIVLYGGSDEDVDLPYRPFAHALGHLARHLDADVIEAHVGAHGGALAPIVPLFASAPGTQSGDAELDRIRMFDAAADLLGRAAARTPTLLVLDDLHWADGSTLRLLRHLVREIASTPLLVLATYRDTDVDRTHPLAPMLADLRRQPSVTRLSLDGLDAASIADVLTRSAGHDVEGVDRLSALLQEETDGNPFFLGEVIRHLIESGAFFQSEGRWSADRDLLDRVGVPEGVRDVIGRRLSALPDELSDILRVAAVVGYDFDGATVARVADLDVADVLDHLDTATQRGLLAETGRRGRWRFAHALVRQTLAEELSMGRRLRVHHRVAVALEASGADTVTVAHHYCEAAVLADADKAVALASAAGQEAIRSLAWEQAERWFARALEAEENVEPTDERRRAALLLDLGDAMNAAGDTVDARQHFESAAAIGQRLGDGDLVLRAALGFGDWTAIWLDPTDPRPMQLLDAAEAMLAPGDGEARVDVMVKRAGLLTFSPDGDARRELVDDAIAIARRVGGRDGLLSALMAGCDATRAQPDPARLLALSEEAWALAQQGPNRYGGMPLYFAAMAHAVAGRIDDQLATAELSGRVADEMRHVQTGWSSLAHRAGVAAARGESDAAQLIEAARVTGGSLGETAEFVAYAQHRWAQGFTALDRGALVAVMRDLQDRWPALMNSEGVLRAQEAALGDDHDAAVRILHEEIDALGEGPATFRAVAATNLVWASYWLDDRDSARRLRPQLEPWTGLIVTGAGELWGLSGDHYLGYLDRAEGDLESAVTHLTAAYELYARNGVIFRALAGVDLAEVLSQLGRIDEARDAAESVRALIAERSYTTLAARVAALALG